MKISNPSFKINKLVQRQLQTPRLWIEEILMIQKRGKDKKDDENMTFSIESTIQVSPRDL